MQKIYIKCHCVKRTDQKLTLSWDMSISESEINALIKGAKY